MTELLVPLILCGAAMYGQWKRVDVYAALMVGAGDGLGVLLRIVPALVGLLTAVYMLRASGALELAEGKGPRRQIELEEQHGGYLVRDQR